MKYPTSASAFAIFSIFLANPCLASGRMTKQNDSGPLSFTSGENADEGWRNGDIKEAQIMEDDMIAGEMREKQWRPGERTNVRGPYDPRSDAEEETENRREFLGKLSKREEDESWLKSDHDRVQRNKNLRPNETLNAVHVKRGKHRRNKSARNHRRRHSRKLNKEIASLHDEISHIVADLDDMTEKETELQQEIDELRILSDHREENTKQSLKIYLPENGKHHSIRNAIGRKFSETAAEDVGTLDLLEEKFDLMEDEDRDLKDQDVGRERKPLEEIKDLRKEIGEVQNKNRKLRGKNRELRRQLCHFVTQQDGHNKMSNERGETLEEEALVYSCGKFFREMAIEHRESGNPHRNEDRDKTEGINSGVKENENTQGVDTTFGEARAKRINRRNKKGKHFPKSLSETKDKMYRSRELHNHDADDELSAQKFEEHKAGEIGAGPKKQDDRNSGHRSGTEKEVKSDDYMFDPENAQTSRELTDYDNENTSEGRSEMSEDEENERSSRVSKRIRDGAVFRAVSDDSGKKGNSEIRVDEKLREGEQANLTISTAEEDKEKVYDHIASVDDAIFCGKPQPVVIYPADEYPVPNKYYTPQGTILHRCSNHSGCCPNEQLTCVPAKKENVVLHFFAAVLDGSSAAIPHVEKLQFTNHTKCGCVFKHHAHYYL